MTTKKIRKQKLKRFTAGVLSPITASKKIQSITRGKLAREKIKNLDFRKKDLYGETFSGKKLDYSRFDGADLRWSKMNKCILNNVIAIGSNFTNAQLKESTVNNSNFTDSIFIEANLHSISCSNSTFDNCKFNYVKRFHSLSEVGMNITCNLNSSKFVSCSLKKCLFGHININNSVFYKCDLSKSRFKSSHVSLNSIKLDQCCMDNVIIQDYANLFAFIKNPIALNGDLDTINNLTIINLSDNPISRQERSGKTALLTTKFKYIDTTFNNLYIQNLFF